MLRDVTDTKFVGPPTAGPSLHQLFLGAFFHVAGAREPNVSEQPVPAMPFGKAPVAVSWAPPGQT